MIGKIREDFVKENDKRGFEGWERWWLVGKEWESWGYIGVVKYGDVEEVGDVFGERCCDRVRDVGGREDRKVVWDRL